MEAPKFGSGEYTISTVSSILTTAYTAFLVARIDSHMCGLDNPRVIIHTGHWGTGAYGGNKVLMAVLQIAAAHFAGVDQLVYWALSEPETVREAMTVVDEIVGNGCSSTEFLHKVVAKKYKWGQSNGT